MTATLDDEVADLRRANAALQQRLDERTAERDEALERETATAEVLGVINSSPGDLTLVFEAMVDKALGLCEASFGGMYTYNSEQFQAVAHRGVPVPLVDYLRQPQRPGPGTSYERLVHGELVVHVLDISDDEVFRSGYPARVAMVELGGARTAIWVALRKTDALLGAFVIYRQEVRPFTDKQIALLQNFAAQAVIAMENARLITETQEALEQQTATAEVLGVINSSPGDLAPVFEAMLEKALELCDAAFGRLDTYDGEFLRTVATRGVPPAYANFLGRAVRPAPGNTAFRLVQGEEVVRIGDMREDEENKKGDPARLAVIELGGARSMLQVGLRKDDVLIGRFVIYRTEVKPFSDKQVALLQNFAAQAVIAMENARLITETREALDQQTATAEVLKVISRSTFDLQPVLHAVVESASRLCKAEKAILYRHEDDAYRYAAGYSNEPDYERIERETPIYPGEGSVAGRAALHKRAVQIVDALSDPLYEQKEAAQIGRARSMIGVPLLREGEPIGVIALARERVERFSGKEIELVTTFADQAVIAMENARLITETREARDTAEAAYRDLKAAQANLIQAEKMASLGQLTAGIAHEIKNPLNFVNNFAGLSVELLDELKEATESAVAALGQDKRAEVDETIELLTGNLEKIAEHGKRADNIVKSMLEHSRGVSGERREVDLNQLVEEALNLAYHGARAQDQSFNITLERDYAQSLKPIALAPQEITRVFLNLFGNGFYAANKRSHDDGDESFRPTLTVATRDDRDAVEVRIRDNGTGIPPDIKDKLFQPFFTTKPTGEGTGLGLSISYDIVTQQHGGTITVDSRVGEFTEFTVRLPRH
jgi:two-component system, NtrC family, sensor kinase